MRPLSFREQAALAALAALETWNDDPLEVARRAWDLADALDAERRRRDEESGFDRVLEAYADDIAPEPLVTVEAPTRAELAKILDNGADAAASPSAAPLSPPPGDDEGER